ncbi:tripartite tricarboxylate transporter TctB family protein [Arvimicrobium flavum]|uniref:tripartite tricarboxylate transporter TctB family protein n=1 Tax=Arvimicrobium flavum TaxID=3393320 RepID=UPI00237B9217|nr:tripartite tricarboxylate transporter TctB family protein [Mesorhizobium shangrilense]
MLQMLSLDRLIALICILIAAIYLSASFSIVQGSFGDPMGPRVFPEILGTLLILLSVVMLVNAAPEQEEEPQRQEGMPRRTVIAIAVCVGLVVGFIVLLPLIGYPLTTFIVTLGFLLALRERLIHAFGYASGLTALFYVVFDLLLRTPFPKSAIGGLF